MVQDLLLGEIARQLCGLGVCLAKENSNPLPICTQPEARKLERCITKVKARNVQAECKPGGTGSKICPNPFAVCRAALGCRLGGEPRYERRLTR